MMQTIGFFWRPDQIHWGAGSQPGKLLGVPATNTPIDFREQSGIYVLYSEFHPIYVGQAGSGNQKLFARLKQHRSDDLSERWDRFSWFGLRRVLSNGDLSKENQATHPAINVVLNLMEAVLIHAMEPAHNDQGGRFGSQVERYLQTRDERLGPTPEEMIRDLWNALLKLESNMCLQRSRNAFERYSWRQMSFTSDAGTRDRLVNSKSA